MGSGPNGAKSTLDYYGSEKVPDLEERVPTDPARQELFPNTPIQNRAK